MDKDELGKYVLARKSTIMSAIGQLCCGCSRVVLSCSTERAANLHNLCPTWVICDSTMSADAGNSENLSLTNAAEEFVEKMTDTETPLSDQQEGGSKVSMEERKAKLEQLRKKMVRELAPCDAQYVSRRP